MKKLLAPMIASTAIFAAAPAMAQSEDRAGTIQIKAFATAVLPDGEITDVVRDDFGLPAGSQSEASNNVTPTLAIEYFVTNNISIETIAGVTQHDVDGLGGLEGLELVSDAQIIPATVTAKYHIDVTDGFTPYVGAGPSYFLIFNDDAGAGVTPLGVTDVDLSNELGFALQAGADITLGDSGFGLSIDAKRYFIGTTATFEVNGTDIIETDHDLDPWVVSAGVSFRF